MRKGGATIAIWAALAGAAGAAFAGTDGLFARIAQRLQDRPVGGHFDLPSASRERDLERFVVIPHDGNRVEVLEMHPALGPVAGDRLDLLHQGGGAAAIDMLASWFLEMIPEIIEPVWVAVVMVNDCAGERLALIQIGGLFR